MIWFVGGWLLWILVVEEFLEKFGGFEFEVGIIFGLLYIVFESILNGVLSLVVFFILFVIVLYCLICFCIDKVGGLFIFWCIRFDRFVVCVKMLDGVCKIIDDMIWFFGFGKFWIEVFGIFMFIEGIYWSFLFWVVVILFVWEFLYYIIKVLFGLFEVG